MYNSSCHIESRLHTFLDIDECLLSIDECTDNCTNTEGGYECSCSDGYMLDTDKTTCIGNHYVYTLILIVQ